MIDSHTVQLQMQNLFRCICRWACASHLFWLWTMGAYHRRRREGFLLEYDTGTALEANLYFSSIDSAVWIDPVPVVVQVSMDLATRTHPIRWRTSCWIGWKAPSGALNPKKLWSTSRKAKGTAQLILPRKAEMASPRLGVPLTTITVLDWVCIYVMPASFYKVFESIGLTISKF
jgi:hypothetical protein